MIEIHLRGTVAAGQRVAFEQFLVEAIPYYEAPGDIRVRILWSIADADRFIEIIEYADQDAHDRDQLRVENDVRMRELLGRWRDLLNEPPVVETYIHGVTAAADPS